MKKTNKKSLPSHFLSLCLALILLPWFSGCKESMELLHKEVIKYGYIPYTTPLQYAGTGTLVGGAPSALTMIAHPQTCFPDEISNVATGLRKQDDTVVPKKRYSMRFSGEARFKLLKMLNLANPVLSAGLQFSHVETIDLTMEGVHVEYMDSVVLTEFYRTDMSETCKQYLNFVGFIIQALKVDKLSLRFYKKDMQALQITVENIKQILDIDARMTWEIENESTLNFTSPKYVGFQLGSLRQSDEGMVLYRANTVKKDKFIFRPLYVFDSLEHTEDFKTPAHIRPKDMIDYFSKYYQAQNIK